MNASAPMVRPRRIGASWGLYWPGTGRVGNDVTVARGLREGCQA